LIIYRFDGTTLTQVTTANPTGGAIQVNGVAWSPDGKYLSIAYRTTGGSGWYQLFLFNGLTLSSITYGGNSGNATSVAWSHDQRFIAFGRYNGVGGNCTIIGFNGTATVTYPVSIDLGTQVNAVAWSPNGRYLLVCSSNGGSGIYGLYKVNISGATELLGTPAFGTVATTVAWSPDSKYVLVGGTNGTTDLMVFPTTMTATAASTQGFSNGLLFGDKAKGSAYDADVRVLSSATVKVRGKIKDDSV
jgi:WD40 repeat protein